MNIRNLLCLATTLATTQLTYNAHSEPINVDRIYKDLGNLGRRNYTAIVQEISQMSFAHHIDNIRTVYNLSPQIVKNQYNWIDKNYYKSSIYNVLNKIISSTLSNTQDENMKYSDGIYIPKGFKLKDLSVSYWNYTIMYNFIHRTLIPLLKKQQMLPSSNAITCDEYKSMWDLEQCKNEIEKTVDKIERTFDLSEGMKSKISKAKSDCIQYAMATRLGRYITAQNAITLSKIHNPHTLHTKLNGLNFGAHIQETHDIPHFDRPINVGFHVDDHGVEYNDIVLSTPYVSSYTNNMLATKVENEYDLRIVETYLVPLYATFVEIPNETKSSDVEENARNFKGVVHPNFIDSSDFNPRDDILGSISSFYKGKHPYIGSPFMRVTDIVYDLDAQKVKTKDIKTYINAEKIHLNWYNYYDTLNGFSEADKFIKGLHSNIKPGDYKTTNNALTDSEIKEIVNQIASAKNDEEKLSMYKQVLSLQ